MTAELVALARHGFVEDRAGRAIRLAALALYAALIIGLAVSAWRWAEGGVDGILSQREVPSGFEVRQVRPGAAAGAAGLRPGDVIVARDGVPATDRTAYWLARREGRAGERITLDVRRTGGITDQLILSLTPTLSLPDNVALLGVLALTVVLVPGIGLVVLLARPADFAARLLWGSTVLVGAIEDLYTWDKAVGVTVDPVWHWFAYLVPQAIAASLRLHMLAVFPVRIPWLAGPHRSARASLRRIVVLVLIYLGVALSLAQVLLAFGAPLDLAAVEAPLPGAFDGTTYVITLQLLAGLALVIYGYRRAATPTARGAMYWLLFGLLFRLVTSLYTTGTQVALLGGHIEPLSNVMARVSTIVLYSAFGLAVVRYRLFEISPLVRRALVYPLAIALLVGAYDLFSGAIGRGLVELLGAEVTSNPLFAALPLIVIAALFRPLRSRLQTLLDRSLDRTRAERRAYVDEATRTLSVTQPAGVVVDLLTRRASEVLRLNARLVTEPAKPAATGSDLVLPLRVGPAYEGQSVGFWVLGERPTKEPFDTEDVASLSQVAALAALQLDYARLRGATVRL